MGNESDDEKASDSAWCEQAVQHGMRFARDVFAKRGSNPDVHISEAELAAMMAVSFERGARTGAGELVPNETTIAAMLEARDGNGKRFATVDELLSDLRDLQTDQSTIKLTRRDSMQMLDTLENPKPRSQKFVEAMARYKEMKDEQWQRENAESIRSSNEYVEKHGLPLAKYRMPSKSGEGEYGAE